MSDKRNPYVLLGVPFGAAGDDAAAAFAKRARGLRRAANGTERLRDLTWALNQVQEFLRQPDLSLDVYRVPADAGALEPDGDGVLRPPPEPLPRRGDSTAHRGELLDVVAQEVLTAARLALASCASLPAR